MDNVSVKIRSEIMSRVRSRGNKSTEKRLRAYLIRYGLKGWRINATDVLGSPDVFFDKKHLAIFVDGCFWHGCKKCYRRPKSKKKFWDSKVKDNILRDKHVNKKLKLDGISVFRIPECILKTHPKNIVATIRHQLS